VKVMIVDDEPAARRTLRECCAGESDLEIIGEYAEGASALAAVRM
jgi:two-component system, LytTR family, response regulator